jgi:outer membrane protein assembly factor BamB
VDGDLLFTMYRVNDDEFAVALDAKTGKTVWEHKNPSPFTKEMAEFGPGPHSTPLIVGDRLYTIGTNAVLHGFDKKSGKVLWKHDLPAEYGAPVPGRGYGASPIAYKNTVIVVVDRKHEEVEPGKEAPKAEPGQAQSLMAFDQETGSVVWKAQDFDMSYASPIMIKFDGKDQLVIFTGGELAGLSPENGELLWTLPHKTQFGANLSSPMWNGKDILFCSAAYDSGSRAVKLSQKDGKTLPEELWYSRKMRIHHGNSVHAGNYVYGSSGDFGPAFFMGMDLPSGKIAWRERGFSKANCVLAAGKLIILDEDGQLALATATPDGLTVHSKCKLLEKYAWAAPTLVGTKLYIRDRKNIMALELG